MAAKKVVDVAKMTRRLEKAFSRAEAASPQNVKAMDRVLTRIEKMSGNLAPSERLKQVRRWSGGSVDFLSPAGLAEGVAGATVKAMRDSGAPMTPQEMMKKKGMPKGRIVKGTRRGERA